MPHFICLEGVDAVGKSEVSVCLAKRLGYEYYKSPGGPFSAARKIVDSEVDPLTRYFFYRAATQYDSREIERILKFKGIVCDRYIYSTFAFHGAMDAQIQPLFELTQLVMPDFTFVLSAREDVRMRRLKQRAGATSLELNLALQRQADRIFKSFGHTVIDTSDNTVEETVDAIVERLNAGVMT